MGQIQNFHSYFLSEASMPFRRARVFKGGPMSPNALVFQIKNKDEKIYRMIYLSHEMKNYIRY